MRLIILCAVISVSGYALGRTYAKGIAEPITTIITGDWDYPVRLSLIMKPSDMVTVTYADGRVEQEIPPSVIAKYVLEHLQDEVLKAYDNHEDDRLSHLLQMQSEWSQFRSAQMGREIGFYGYELPRSEPDQYGNRSTTSLETATETYTATTSDFLSTNTTAIPPRSSPPVAQDTATVIMATWHQYTVWMYAAIAFDIVMVYQ